MTNFFKPIAINKWSNNDRIVVIRLNEIFSAKTLLLIDIFVDEKWIGSRRTIDQTKKAINWYLNSDSILEDLANEKKKETEQRLEEKSKRVEKIVSNVSTSDRNAVTDLLDDLSSQNPEKKIDAEKNQKAIDWFVGQILKANKGKYQPVIVKDIATKYFNKNSDH